MRPGRSRVYIPFHQHQRYSGLRLRDQDVDSAPLSFQTTKAGNVAPSSIQRRVLLSALFSPHDPDWHRYGPLMTSWDPPRDWEYRNLVGCECARLKIEQMANYMYHTRHISPSHSHCTPTPTFASLGIVMASGSRPCTIVRAVIKSGGYSALEQLESCRT